MRSSRSKVGCFTCRRRKKKCNEQRPVCCGCIRNGLSCQWPASPSGQSVPHGQALPSDYVELKPASSTGTVIVPVLAGSQCGGAQRTNPRRRHDMLGPELEKEQLHHQQDQRRAEAMEKFLASRRRRELERAPAPPGSNSDAVIDALRADAILSSASSSDSNVDTETDSLDADTCASSASSNGASYISWSRASPPCSPKCHEGVRAVESGARTSSHPSEKSVSIAGSNVPGLASDTGGLCRASIASSLPHAMIGTPLMPHHSPQSSELLSYYLARTANSMGNGSTDVNPFVVKLIPMAFSNSFILQLILAQSAAHRGQMIEDSSVRAVAQQYYTKSLRLFSNVIGAYVQESRIDALIISFGSLIMSLTEIARGEIHGTVFHHLSAAESLMGVVISSAQKEAHDGLLDFLIEYYLHMTATSMLSIDVQYGSQLFLTRSIRPAAEALVARQYVGQVCGAWLELLLLIPQIFQLGQRILGKEGSGENRPPPDTIIAFGSMQSRILAFSPPPSANAHTNLAGLVFKQAVLLYLWTMLGNPVSNDMGDSFSASIRGAVAEAVHLLERLPATERVNTSLCWPLTIIGCCTADSGLRCQLRERLLIMSRTIGLGNMKRTLALLEGVWEEDADEISPWTLCKSMQKHQMWISLA